MVKSFNASFVAFVLKDFRPINLTDSVYKIVAEVIAEMLKMVIGKPDSGCQNAFIKGRQITDATLIANEVME